MIKAIIVEDEEPARLKLCAQLNELALINLVGVATSGKEAITLIDLLLPDLVFMDIELTDMKGLEVIHSVKHTPAIIFTTAYKDYTLNAFEINAVDYLLKPYSTERLKNAIERVVEKINHQATNKPKATNRFLCEKNERSYFLSYDNTYYIEAEKPGTRAWDGKQWHLMQDSLNQLESKLPGCTFVRLHRKYIVNIDNIKEIQKWFNGKCLVILKDESNTKLTSSRMGFSKLKAVIQS